MSIPTYRPLKEQTLHTRYCYYLARSVRWRTHEGEVKIGTCVGVHIDSVGSPYLTAVTSPDRKQHRVSVSQIVEA